MKKLLSIALVFCIVLGLSFPTMATTKRYTAQEINDHLNATLAKLVKNVPAPEFGTNGGEWTVLTLSRAGYPVPDEYYESYYSKVLATTKAAYAQNPYFNRNKVTEEERLALALASIGKNPEDVGGINLFARIAKFTDTYRQGINGPIFGLIALDSRGYEIPVLHDESKQTTREKFINYILNEEIDGGGFALSGNTADPDITGMALQALAPYKNRADIAPVIDRALAVLSSLQRENGGFSSWGSINAESISQVIVALTALDINPDTDERFIKNDRRLIDALMDFAVDGGGFRHTMTGDLDGMATDQGGYALVAYDRYLKGKRSLYDMQDIEDNPENSLAEDAVSISLPKKVSGEKNSTFNMVVSVGSWKPGTKMMDGVISVPAGIELETLTASPNLSGGNLDYNLTDGKLRFACANPSLADITFSATEFPAELFTAKFKVAHDFPKITDLEIAVKNLSLKPSSSEEFVYDSTNAKDSIQVVESGDGTVAAARELYAGDGSDLIPANKKAVAVEFVNIENIPSISYNGVPFYYSTEITEKKDTHTYVALVDTSIEIDDLSNAQKYNFTTSGVETITFADTNADNVINAQDALDILAAWLRKVDISNEKEILVMNTTADSAINTFDVLSVMENYVNGTEFAVLSK